MRKSIGPLLVLLAVWSCDGVSEKTTGPSDPTAALAPTLSLTLVSRTLAPQSGGPLLFASTDDAIGGNVPLEAVDAINVTIDRVQVLPAAGGPWVTLDVAEGAGAINLLDLPSEGQGDPVVLARAELEPGDYSNARLFFMERSILLNQSVCPGGGTGNGDGEGPGDAGGPPCLEAGEHDIFVPSSLQTGIKTDARFSIGEGGEEETVVLVFDADATIRSIVWAPGLGKMIVAPVIRAADADGGDGEGS